MRRLEGAAHEDNRLDLTDNNDEKAARCRRHSTNLDSGRVSKQKGSFCVRFRTNDQREESKYDAVEEPSIVLKSPWMPSSNAKVEEVTATSPIKNGINPVMSPMQQRPQVPLSKIIWEASQLAHGGNTIGAGIARQALSKLVTQ